jgi:hypothetical protein
MAVESETRPASGAAAEEKVAMGIRADSCGFVRSATEALLEIANPISQGKVRWTKERTTEMNERALNHFVTLARAGNRSTASGGERRAKRIASQLLEDASGLDQDAIEGLCEFARVCAASYTTARDLISPMKTQP